MTKSEAPDTRGCRRKYAMCRPSGDQEGSEPRIPSGHCPPVGTSAPSFEGTRAKWMTAGQSVPGPLLKSEKTTLLEFGDQLGSEHCPKLGSTTVNAWVFTEKTLIGHSPARYLASGDHTCGALSASTRRN